MGSLILVLLKYIYIILAYFKVNFSSRDVFRFYITLALRLSLWVFVCEFACVKFMYIKGDILMVRS